MNEAKIPKSQNLENLKKTEFLMAKQILNKNLPSFTEILLENNKNLFKYQPQKVAKKKENKKDSSFKKTKSRTPDNPRRFSTKIRELDYNSYRAYKMSFDESKNNITKKNKNKSTSEILNNNHNINKVPFGLKSKRFDWQANQERNYLDELYGNNKNYTKRKNSINWEGFLNKETNNDINNIKRNNYAHIYSTIINLNSKRTIQPQRDIIPEIKKKPSKKVIYKSSSTGNIISLFNKTPIIKNIPVNDNITKGNKLFSYEFFNGNFFQKSKGSVDLEKFKNNGYAGLTKEKKSDDYFLYNNDNYNIGNNGFKERIKREKNAFVNENNSRNKKFDLDNNNDKIIHFTHELKHSQLMRIKNNISDIFFIKGGKEKIFRNFKNKQLTYTFDYSQNQF